MDFLLKAITIDRSSFTHLDKRSVQEMNERLTYLVDCIRPILESHHSNLTAWRNKFEGETNLIYRSNPPIWELTTLFINWIMAMTFFTHNSGTCVNRMIWLTRCKGEKLDLYIIVTPQQQLFKYLVRLITNDLHTKWRQQPTRYGSFYPNTGDGSSGLNSYILSVI